MMTVVQGLPASTTNVWTHVRPPDLVTTHRYVELRTARPSELFSAPVQMTRSSDPMENVNLKVYTIASLHFRALHLYICLIAFLVTPTPACVSDRECRDPDKCVDGTCRDACNVDPCGANAICKSRGHASSCTCPIGYTGNPRVQCLKSKFVAIIVMNHLIHVACYSYTRHRASQCTRMPR